MAEAAASNPDYRTVIDALRTSEDYSDFGDLHPTMEYKRVFSDLIALVYSTGILLLYNKLSSAQIDAP